MAKLKKSKYIDPSKGLATTGIGLVYFKVEGWNLLVDLLEEQAQSKTSIQPPKVPSYKPAPYKPETQ